MLFDGRFEDAESHFLYLARELSRSSSPEAKLYRAKALYQAGRIERLYLGQPRRAITRFREALELSPDASFAFDARREISLILHDRLRDYRSAVVELEQLVQSFPDQENIDYYRFRIAQSYFLLRDFDQARSAAENLINKGTENPTLLANAMLLIANSYYAESKYKEAVESHKKLLSIQPIDEVESRSSFELGMCYLELSDFRKAEQYLLRALERHTRPDIVRYQLMVLQERMTEEDNQSLAKLSSATAGRKLVIKVKSKGTRPPIKPPRKKSTPKPRIKKPPQPSQQSDSSSISVDKDIGDRKGTKRPGKVVTHEDAEQKIDNSKVVPTSPKSKNADSLVKSNAENDGSKVEAAPPKASNSEAEKEKPLNEKFHKSSGEAPVFNKVKKKTLTPKPIESPKSSLPDTPPDMEPEERPDNKPESEKAAPSKNTDDNP